MAEDNPAMEEIQNIKEQIKTKEEKEKSASLIGYILTAYILGFIGIFLAIFLKRTLSDLGTDGITMLESTGGGIINTMVQVGWVVGGAGVGVGLLLTVFFIIDKMKKREKPELENEQEKTKENVTSELDSLNKRTE